MLTNFGKESFNVIISNLIKKLEQKLFWKIEFFTAQNSKTPQNQNLKFF